MILSLLWVFAMMLLGVWWVRHDMRAYRRFASLHGTASRQRIYWLWIAQSFAILVGASLVSLWLAGGLSPFDSFPQAFAPAHQALAAREQTPSGEALLGMALGMTLSASIVIALQWRRIRKLLSQVPGPADALIPRNRSEAAIALVLSLNAGFSEELFFRLALPLLLFQLTHSLEIAFGLSVVLFGLVHAYQGWKGVAATMAAGAVLSLYYLSHGSLLRVIIVHSTIDVIALLVRPLILNLIARRTASGEVRPA